MALPYSVTKCWMWSISMRISSHITTFYHGNLAWKLYQIRSNAFSSDRTGPESIQGSVCENKIKFGVVVCSIFSNELVAIWWTSEHFLKVHVPSLVPQASVVAKKDKFVNSCTLWPLWPWKGGQRQNPYDMWCTLDTSTYHIFFKFFCPVLSEKSNLITFDVWPSGCQTVNHMSSQFGL